MIEKLVILLVIQSIYFSPGLSAPVEEEANIYAIIFDAGSSGTRAWAFEFEENDGELVLKDYLVEKYNPGLSDYSTNPDEGVESIAELLEKVEGFVPEADRHRTLIALGATAGLRLLPASESGPLITGIQQLFEKSSFLTTSDSASILSGSTEGIYGWTSVNFLAGKLHGETSDMLAALDLGGSSTQIVYPRPDADMTLSEDDIYSIVVPGYWKDSDTTPSNVQLYSHSYMGLGLSMARIGIMLLENPENNYTLTSSCVYPGVEGSLEYGGITYTVIGSSEPSKTKKRIKKCSKLIEEYISLQNVTKESGILDFDTVAFSNFYNTAVDADLIDESDNENSIKVSDIEKAAEDFCSDSTSDKKFYLCQDLLYIVTLLKDGYGFHSKSSLQVVESLADVEVSWALGGALNLLQTL